MKWNWVQSIFVVNTKHVREIKQTSDIHVSQFQFIIHKLDTTTHHTFCAYLTLPLDDSNKQYEHV